MKKLCHVQTMLVLILLFIQQIISGCTAPVTKDLYKKDLYKEEVDLIGRDLFKDKCSLCHELPDIDTYPYTPEDWSSIIDIMHDTKAAKKFITVEEAERIKVFLRRYTVSRQTK
ncbi:MAG: c-type cytochrome [Planctomycetota bacterium]|jgi:hypothetical protein